MTDGPSRRGETSEQREFISVQLNGSPVKMEIRPARYVDIPAIMETYDIARRFMRSTGNPAQWAGGYPSEKIVAEGMDAGKHFVCEANGKIVGTFWFGVGDDPTYAKIYDGAWLDDGRYGVVHRLASNLNVKGVAGHCLGWCFERAGNNLRVDTHRDNCVMQDILGKNGFFKCGIIYLQNGDERIAFQKVDKK